MRKVYILAVFVILVFISLSFSEDKIGYIDSKEIIDGYEGISNLSEQLNKMEAEWEKEAVERRLEIDKLKSELVDQKLMLSDESKSKKKKEIEKKEKEYEGFIREIWGEDGKSVEKQEELIKPVIEEISNILEKIGSEEGYTMIFDISKGNIVFAKTGLDLSERVLYEINKEFMIVSPEIEKSEFYVFLFKEMSSKAESQSLGEQISLFIKAGLDKLPNFESVESSRSREAMSLLGFLKEEDLDDNQVRLVSRRINARIVVFGKIDQSSGKITVKLKWIDYDRGNEIRTKDFSIDEKEKLEELAQEIMTYLGREMEKE
jgi:Skp family chaperone for outer membrane proteins